MDIKNAFFHHQIPLKGAPTSHPWLSFGPLFYWLYAPLLILSKFNPMSHAYFGAGIAILTIVVNYIFIKKLFSEMNWTMDRYKEVENIIRNYIPNIGIGKEGFKPV